MNSIGIDHGQHYTLVAVREGCESTDDHMLEPKGGRLIEHAGAGAGFWQQLRSHVSDHLGGLSAPRASGYEMVIATNCQLNLDAGLAAVGWEQAEFIGPTDAVLSAWLVEHKLDSRPVRVGVIACGDTWTHCAAYTLRPDGEVSGQAAPSLPGGHQLWSTRLWEQLAGCFDRSATEIPTDWRWQALREMPLFALRLSSGGDAEWKGSLRRYLPNGFHFSKNDCQLWPEMVGFEDALLERLQSMLPASISSYDAVLVGGVGTLWPFAGEAAAKLGPVWRASAPETSVARGAAAWAMRRFQPLVGEMKGFLSPSVSPAVATMSPPGGESRSGAVSGGDVRHLIIRLQESRLSRPSDHD